MQPAGRFRLQGRGGNGGQKADDGLDFPFSAEYEIFADLAHRHPEMFQLADQFFPDLFGLQAGFRLFFLRYHVISPEGLPPGLLFPVMLRGSNGSR